MVRKRQRPVVSGSSETSADSPTGNASAVSSGLASGQDAVASGATRQPCVREMMEQLGSLADDLLAQLEQLPAEMLRARRGRLETLLARVDGPCSPQETPGSTARGARNPTVASEWQDGAAAELPPTSTPPTRKATAFTSSSPAGEAASTLPRSADAAEPGWPSAAEQVLLQGAFSGKDGDILARVLGFHGTLCPWHAHYDLLVGWRGVDSYQDTRRGTEDSLNRYRMSLMHSLGVCRSWHRLNTSEKTWRTQARLFHSATLDAAGRVASNPEVSWHQRLHALAICDRPSSLREALEGEGLRQALAFELEGGVHLPADAPRKLVRGAMFAAFPVPYNLHECGCAQQIEEFIQGVCMLNAVCAGATECVCLLNRLYGPWLWNVPLNDKSGVCVLTEAVEYACRHACLKQPVQGIKAMLSGVPASARSAAPDDYDGLHQRVRGSNGNVLHVAAARGHADLVRVLLDAGLRPNVRAQEKLDGECFADGGRGRPHDYAPHDYAVSRGHREVERILIEASRSLRPQILQLAGAR